MDATVPLVIPLYDASALGNSRVGCKAEKLSELIASGHRVPQGCRMRLCSTAASSSWMSTKA